MCRFYVAQVAEIQQKAKVALGNYNTELLA